MLSRVADSLFWLSRYLERAESVASLVDTNLQLMLDLPAKRADRLAKDWSPIVAGLGQEQAFRRLRRRADARTVADYLVFERQTTDSMVSCLAAARENARTVREQITPEMWEQINRTYLWSVSKGARQYFERSAYEFFQRITKSLQLFQGIVDAVMIRGEGWEFLQMGKFLERADKVTRLLDDRFHLLRPSGEQAPADVEEGWSELLTRSERGKERQQVVDGVYHCWTAVLRCCRARGAYQRLYPLVVEPANVAELLLLNENFPRSALFCVSRVDRALRRISGVASGRFSNRAEKLSGQLAGELRFSSIEDILASGLHETMDGLQVKLNSIGEAIRSIYIYPPLLQQ